MARSVTGMYRAVKVVRREDFEYERTFEREFEGIQRYEQVSKDHPGLVDVLHVGRDDEAGFYYYVMELADDKNGQSEEVSPATYQAKTLSSEMKASGAKSIIDTVNLGISLAGALGHLHEAGLTHRDVKPSNIIFVKGIPKLADVGLVAQSGQRTYVGTEGYVPPEGPGTSSADLYSLAMVLYEAHTKKDRLDFPELPTNLDIPPTVNRDEWRQLNTVICRAGSPDPKKRYKTARALAIALREVIEGNRSFSSGRKGLRAGVFLSSLVVLAILAATGYGAYWLWKDSIEFRDDNSVQLAASGPVAGNITDPNSAQTSGIELANNTTKENEGEATSEDGQDKQGNGKEKGQGKGGNPGNGSFTIISDNNNIIDGGVVIRDDVISSGGSAKTELGSEEESQSQMTVGDPRVENDPLQNANKDTPKVVAQEVIGQLKVMSRPSGAAVWVDGKEVGVTPRPLALPVGTVDIILKYPGFHDLIYETVVKEGFVVVEKSLIKDQRPRPGTSWVNKLGMVFEADQFGNSLTQASVSTALFDEFIASTGNAIPLNDVKGLAYVSDEKSRWAFADWLTGLDQAEGYLGPRQYYRPIPGSESLRDHDFKLDVDSRMGTILLNSDPPGALIRKDGKVIGDTEETISNLRLGPYEFELDMPGYQIMTVSGTLNNVEPIPLNEVLVPDQSVVFGTPWSNSQGMPLLPVGEVMVATYETPLMDYQDYVTEMQIALPATAIGQELNHPVTGIARNEAELFCEWLTLREQNLGMIRSTQRYRLPTDTEWSLFVGIEEELGSSPSERGERGEASYPWGDSWPPARGSGNYADESAAGLLRNYVILGYRDNFPATSAIGSFGPAENGLFDLSGNVAEWVSDNHGSGGPDLGVVRGGDWNTYEQKALSLHYRNPVPVDSREDVFGFRYVLEDFSSGS